MAEHTKAYPLSLTKADLSTTGSIRGTWDSAESEFDVDRVVDQVSAIYRALRSEPEAISSSRTTVQ